jgi:hypothetical protein
MSYDVADELHVLRRPGRMASSSRTTGQRQAICPPAKLTQIVSTCAEQPYRAERLQNAAIRGCTYFLNVHVPL